ncbi:MAG: endonuclease I family protein [Roseibacillus sp.]
MLQGAAPAGYYDSAEGLTGLALKQTLHEIIDDHNVISYTSTDEVMREVFEDPENSANVELIYSDFSMPKGDLGSSGASVWNREHVWPRSYCIGNSGPDNSDLHNLYPCNASVNSSRGNKFFDETTGSGTMNSVSPENTYDSDSWEPDDVDKGMVARAVLYVVVRYDGSDSGTGDMELGDVPDASSCRMGVLTTMLAWNRMFPPTAAERARNDGIYEGVSTTAGFLRQGNRNPFVDFPQFADAIFLGSDVLTFGKWQLESFSLAQIGDDLLSGPEADPDQDGYANLVEFVSNSDPLSTQSEPFSESEIEGGNLVLRYRKVRNLELSGYSYRWEVSSDLESWMNAPQTATEEVDEGEAAIESLTFSGANDRYFWRLSIGSGSI